MFFASASADVALSTLLRMVAVVEVPRQESRKRHCWTNPMVYTSFEARVRNVFEAKDSCVESAESILQRKLSLHLSTLAFIEGHASPMRTESLEWYLDSLRIRRPISA